MFDRSKKRLKCEFGCVDKDKENQSFLTDDLSQTDVRFFSYLDA